jgi:hypothetical protein
MMCEVKTRIQDKRRLKLNLPVGSAQIELPPILSGGVRVGDGLGAGSLILIPDALFLTSFQGFFFLGGVSTAFRLRARV